MCGFLYNVLSVCPGEGPERGCLTLVVINLMAALWLLMEGQCLSLLLPWS